MDLVEPLRRLGWQPGEPVVLAVSGGADSMALLELATRARLSGWVAHMNYGLRGADAVADAQWVVREAVRRGWPCRVAHRPVGKGNVQAEARKARYTWMEAMGAWVLTAHHADDQAETVLLHVMRAVDPVAALAGMPARRGMVLRPLLQVRRADLRTWAVAQGVRWREDASNAEGAYLRNRVRHEVLPLLEELRPGTVGHLGQISARARDLATDLAPFKAPADPNRFALAPRAAFHTERLWAWGRLHGVSGSVLAGLANPGAFVDVAGGRITRDRDALVFAAARDGFEPVSIPRPAQGGAAAGLHWEVLEGQPAEPRVDRAACLLDADAVVWPLTLRVWQPGDRIAPFGFDGHQLISDLLTQAKVPPSERAAHRVLVDAAGTVHWLVGLRASRAAALTPPTQQTLRFTAP